MRIQLNHILCATDLSEASDQAVAYGIALAREFQALLIVCHCVDLPAPSIHGEAYLAPEEQLNRNIDYASRRIAELMEGHTVEWEPLIIVGHAADEINRVARERSVDITVSATRGRRGLKRLLLGSVTERLMRTLPCPLLVIPAAEHDIGTTSDGALRFEKILVGCDFSPDADLALRNALRMAQEFQAALHLVHIIETPLYTETLKPVFCASSGLTGRHSGASAVQTRRFRAGRRPPLVPAGHLSGRGAAASATSCARSR